MFEKLLYTELASSVNPSFWSKLTEIKLNVDMLNENARHVWGYFHFRNTGDLPESLLEVDSTSFNLECTGKNLYVPFHGRIINKNTVEQFKECNKMELIENEGRELLSRIEHGDILSDPSLLNNFMILSFSDLKKYHYYYWFAFPVPKDLIIEKVECYNISNDFKADELSEIRKEFFALKDNDKSYFILRKNENELKMGALNMILQEVNADNVDDFYFAFFNITHDVSYVGSQLRNYIAFILHYCPFLKGKTQKFISIHLVRTNSYYTCDSSMIYKLKLPDDIKNCLNNWVGWEKNDKGKMGPRLANMKSSLDPLVLAEQSIDLNLKLMKWRLMPNIDLEILSKSKCLLLGSGTLGCAVGRNLLAWGVRNITFVDNSTVSFSNPVRQSLFTYEDSVKMKPKALAAAHGLKQVFPSINAEGVELTIPMPGHSVGDSMMEQTRESVLKLEGLIQKHDIVFLLTDSRESRWLPTVIACSYGKVVINAALGFDTYLVMRHGLRDNDSTEHRQEPSSHSDGFKKINGCELGCYFCNDVTAPGNSAKDRTLDQQCTVTRPGVSQIAGALAVELAVSLMQHKEGGHAPAFYTTNQKTLGSESHNDCILGLVPHSIRGFLSSFEQILPATMKYKNCVACSEMILNEYKEKGFDFLVKVFNSSKCLEDVTHLTEMYNEIDLDNVLVLSDGDDFE